MELIKKYKKACLYFGLLFLLGIVAGIIRIHFDVVNSIYGLPFVIIGVALILLGLQEIKKINNNKTFAYKFCRFLQYFFVIFSIIFIGILLLTGEFRWSIN